MGYHMLNFVARAQGACEPYVKSVNPFPARVVYTPPGSDIVE